MSSRMRRAAPPTPGAYAVACRLCGASDWSSFMVWLDGQPCCNRPEHCSEQRRSMVVLELKEEALLDQDAAADRGRPWGDS